MQDTFDLFSDTTGRHVGQQERATMELVRSLRERSHGSMDPFALTLCTSLLSLAQNIDSQRDAGREISRNMNTYLDNVQRLQELYPPEVRADDDVEAVWDGIGTDLPA